MYDDILTPKDRDFYDWDYGTEECIEQLMLFINSVKPSVSFISEWVALSLETQSVAYYKNDLNTVEKLVKVISYTFLQLDPKSLQEFPSLLHTGLRAVLCQSPKGVDASQLVELYRMLDPIPNAKNLDIHVMFQCYFGFSNTLSRWQSDFNYHKQENGWHDYNAVQLEVGIALNKARIYKESALLTKLDEKFSDYILALEDMPLAAEWFPWLSWFVLQKI